MKTFSLILVSILALSTAWGEGTKENGPESSNMSGEVVAYTAASLTQAFTDIGNEFMKMHPRVTVTFNFAGSQRLAQQLAFGASADVFASANMKQMDVAVKAGRVAAGAQKLFARNRLIAVVSRNPTFAISTLKELARPGVKIVLAAQAVPVGSYTRVFLAKAAKDPAFGPKYRQAVLANTVSLEENVRAVLNKVVLGEADAGIVYSSDLTAGSADKVSKIDIPDKLNTIADYPIAPVRNSDNPKAAAAFVDLVLSSTGQKILTSYGFLPAKPTE